MMNPNELLEEMWRNCLAVTDNDSRCFTYIEKKLKDLIEYLDTKGIAWNKEERKKYIDPIITAIYQGMIQYKEAIQYLDDIGEILYGKRENRVIATLANGQHVVYVPESAIQYCFPGEDYEGHFKDMTQDRWIIGHCVNYDFSGPYTIYPEINWDVTSVFTSLYTF